MPASSQTQPNFQRNALAPGLLAAVTLLVSPLFLEGTGAFIIRFIVAILALVVAWFAWQAGQWWWTAVFAVVAVLWNPVWPFDFSGTWWTAAQPLAGALFIAAGILIKSVRTAER
ncbi:hypothetical protein FVA74_13050 [Salinibacterium sp. dk2585]|uniref:DUF6804 family protein n=1 Tax=unclassified Salinibacterium TaxID=2632331 RepID=UPI0011C243E5|nr:MULTISPECIES: DUF6804 family protein [unclassified Salinibacterium]QEE62399.1 hypothetical protein FVA74_13050 [Salinibacterium sp. dk2585]TXK52718.1 hypothetical protein FVP63_12345 [Salinibacterium sp. dk5596]